MENAEVLSLLQAPEQLDAHALAALLALPNFSAVYHMANLVRAQHVGNTVHLRAILEFSNYCRCRCLYCGLNAENHKPHRYRMTPDEILATAREAAAVGYRTLVMQSGEDPFFTPELLGTLITEIKTTGMSITVSCGEFSREALAHFRACGADRYLLKHETADPALYRQLHPGHTLAQRVQCLQDIKALGFETGSGFMVGLPHQTLQTVAEDLLLLRRLSCDMAGIGPFIAHPDTPLRGLPSGSTQLTKRAVALARILLPNANLPATTALGVLDSTEKNDIFSCGANVVMQKVTPDPYKEYYEIYPSHLQHTHIKTQREALEAQISSLGRVAR